MPVQLILTEELLKVDASVLKVVMGIFSSDKACPFRINSLGIEQLSLEDFSKGFQITDDNQLFGLENRYKIIKRLGGCLKGFPRHFGHEIKRSGKCFKSKFISGNLFN